MTKKKKNGNVLAEIKSVAAEINENTADHVILAKELKYVDGRLSIPGEKQISMTEWGFLTICRIVNVPRQYLKKCVEHDRMDIINFNINQWLKNDDREVIVRIHKEKVEAVLTGRYIPFSNLSAVEAIESFFDKRNHEYSVQKWNCSLSSFFMRITLDSTQRELRVGDPFSGAIDVINSGVGSAAFSVSPKLLRLVCTNGMVVVDKSAVFERYRRVHLKEMEIPQLHEYLDRAIAQMPNGINAIERIYKESYELYLGAAELWSIFSKIRGGVNRKFVDAMFSEWMEDEQFSVNLAVRVNEENFYNEGKPTLAGFWNSSTKAVQEMEDMTTDQKDATEKYVAFIVFQMFQRMSKT